jgi:transcriptional regulator with GAF, ATPase, and Fis domain
MTTLDETVASAATSARLPVPIVDRRPFLRGPKAIPMPPVHKPLGGSLIPALTEAAQAVTSTLDIETVLETIAKLARKVARSEASSVLSVQGAGKKLLVEAATGSRQEALLGHAFDARLGIAGQVVRLARVVNVADAPSDQAYRREIDHLGSLHTRSLLAAPMLDQGEVIGVVMVANRLDERPFDEENENALQVFAAIAATAVRNARQHAELQRRYAGLRDTVAGPPQIIGDSPNLKRMLRLCDRVAPSNATVLITGETGSGKEVAARYIHTTSKRRNENFVATNCAALPETLLESELFGHEKGAFTGAHARRMGRFEMADKGTLFLDEIGEISRSTQAKLLRVLQEREFVRVGGTETIRCDVRIVAATNRNLKNMMLDGLFREDLYYRLSVFPIHVPSLRERREDIPELAGMFVQRAARDFNAPVRSISPQSMRLLSRYEWRGNIREMQNVIERSVLMSDGETLLPDHLPPDIQDLGNSEEVEDDPSTLHGQEKSMILAALESHGWNQSQAARSLGVTRYHLRHRIRKYNLQKPDA